MKTHFINLTYLILAFCATSFVACHHDQTQKFTIELQYTDGSKETYDMFNGSLLLINDGDMHFVAKVSKGTKDDLEFDVTRYTVIQDTVKKEHSIQKAGSSTRKFSTAKSDLLDPSGHVQVKFQSMAMIDTGKRPRGACQGNCCEAKCFSTFCCSDPDECKDASCDCKPPSNCPGQPTNPSPSHFFEIFKSGKDLMAFKD